MRKRKVYPDDVTIRISCHGRWHNVHLAKGRLRFEGHRSFTDVLFLRAIQFSIPCCGWLLDAVRERRWKVMPRQFARSCQQHIRRLSPRVSPLTLQQQRTKWHDILRRELRLKAITRRYQPLIMRALSFGLHIEPVLDWSHPIGATLNVQFGVQCGTRRELPAPLAVRQPGGSWEVNWNVAQEAAWAINRRGGPHHFWGTRTGVCRVCHRRIPKSQMVDHVRSAAHNAAIQAAIVAVFNLTSGTLPFFR